MVHGSFPPRPGLPSQTHTIRAPTFFPPQWGPALASADHPFCMESLASHSLVQISPSFPSPQLPPPSPSNASSWLPDTMEGVATIFLPPPPTNAKPYKQLTFRFFLSFLGRQSEYCLCVQIIMYKNDCWKKSKIRLFVLGKHNLFNQV